MELNPKEKPNYAERINWDSDEEEENPKLVEVSEKTQSLLVEACTRSVPNNVRRKTRSAYPLPKVAATKTPQMDTFLKTDLSPASKALDKDLAKLQTFVLDALAPLSLVLDRDSKGQTMSKEETLEAVHTAVHLIGNANARISRVRREKAIVDINKALLPLVQDDSNFVDAPPVLFGSEFGRKSKEHVDQVKALRSTISKDPPKRTFFRGNPPGRGGSTYRGRRNGGPNRGWRNQDRQYSNKKFQNSRPQGPQKS